MLPNVIIVSYCHMFYSWTMWLVNLNYTRRSRKLICKWEENCSYCQTFSPELFQFNAKLYLLLLINKKFLPAAHMIQFFANHLEFLRFGISYVNWFEHGLHSLWNSIIYNRDMIILCPHWLWYANWRIILIREWVSIVIKVSIFAA